MHSKGKIEIVFGNNDISIIIDGMIGTGDAAMTFGSIMGTLLKGEDEDIVQDALRVYSEALVGQYIKG